MPGLAKKKKKPRTGSMKIQDKSMGAAPRLVVGMDCLVWTKEGGGEKRSEAESPKSSAAPDMQSFHRIRTKERDARWKGD